MLHEKILQPLTERAAFRQCHETLVEHDADAHVTALQRDNPRPPTVAGKMVRRRTADAVTLLRPHRVLLRQLDPVPILHTRPTRPQRRGWMLVVRAPPTRSEERRVGKEGMV